MLDTFKKAIKESPPKFKPKYIPFKKEYQEEIKKQLDSPEPFKMVEVGAVFIGDKIDAVRFTIQLDKWCVWTDIDWKLLESLNSGQIEWLMLSAFKPQFEALKLKQEEANQPHYTCSGCKYNYVKRVYFNRMRQQCVDFIPGGSCVHPKQHPVREFECKNCYFWKDPTARRVKYEPRSEV